MGYPLRSLRSFMRKSASKFQRSCCSSNCSPEGTMRRCSVCFSELFELWNKEAATPITYTFTIRGGKTLARGPSGIGIPVGEYRLYALGQWKTLNLELSFALRQSQHREQGAAPVP